MVNLTSEQRQLIADDIVAAVTLRKCLKDALAEPEIAMGFRDWRGVKRALELIQRGIQD